MIQYFLKIFYNPRKMFLICILGLTLSLIYSGSVSQLVGLYQAKNKIESKIVEVKKSTQKVMSELKDTESLDYFERQAIERFDYVKEGDLIFVFSD